MSGQNGLGDLPSFHMHGLLKSQSVSWEELDQRDYWEITHIYSTIAREILQFVEEIFDPLEYEGSSLFHEYIDPTMMGIWADQIYEKVRYREPEGTNQKDGLLYSMILILLGGELYYRRLRHKAKKTMWETGEQTTGELEN